MAILPLVMTPSGLQPQAPADIRNALVSKVAALNPDYTANLPGTLIEDICSTDIGAIVESDSFLVDLVNSVTPHGANPFLLSQFGKLYGLMPKEATNTSVYLIFSGPPGFVIVKGFEVTDGTYHYICQDGGIIGIDRQSLPIYAVSNTAGSWSAPAGTVSQLVTSVPKTILDAGFAVNNPADAIPSSAGEEISDYHDRVQTAGLAASTGMARYLRTIVGNIPGVVPRLVSVTQDVPSGRYIALVGGGDPYQVAYAMAQAMFWVIGFIDARINIVGISLTNPAVITTENNHNLLDGYLERIDQVVAQGGLAYINGHSYLVNVIDARRFSINFDAATPGNVYISGGLVTPNPIMEEITIVDWPDTYLIPYVVPAAEDVAVIVTWTSNSPNYVSQVAIAQLAAPALYNYVNSIPCGTNPINIYDMTAIFLDSIASALPPETIIYLNFAVSINGIGTPPAPGTNVIFGDPYSYFLAELSEIVVVEAGQ